MSEELQTGDYVLATKYQDGSPNDHWAVGYYDRPLGDGRHLVVDHHGAQFRANGFRRIGKITEAQGRWLLETIPPLEGGPERNIWDLLATKENSDA